MCGTLSWWAFYLAGVHPALALVPIVPFLPREPRTLDLFADPPDDDAVHHVEHEWNEVVQVVLFLFGLVNAGVILRGLRHRHVGGAGRRARRPAARAFCWRSALALAADCTCRAGSAGASVVVVALATSSGFTFALFFASGVLPVGAVLQQIKLGALATVVGAFVALAVARVIRIGRFAR